MALIDTAYEKALEVLHRCASPLGFKASALAGGYPQVWASPTVADVAFKLGHDYFVYGSDTQMGR